MTDTWATLAADYRALLAECEAVVLNQGHHQPHAIFWRAWRASMADAPRSRAWKARALSLNPEPVHNAIALAGMAPIEWEGRWVLGVALPQPDPRGDCLGEVDDVLLIDPKTGKSELIWDIDATHIEAESAERVVVFTDALAWARDVATHRLEWFHTRADRIRKLQVEPTWPRNPPSTLLLAAPAKVRWSDMRAEILDVPADMRADVRRAMLAQARLPRVEGRA